MMVNDDQYNHHFREKVGRPSALRKGGRRERFPLVVRTGEGGGWEGRRGRRG